eukprot:TRINITY_DN8884_c0_g1_i3.p1 TRINITY_DN8884_c0_g1~~TRINITY_DN8884_c0_g1_i3.p1  ORF type:complete len:493 (+),score=58.73 TRINITY_DN8884_c0_g1_i3:192-1670(+)
MASPKFWAVPLFIIVALAISGLFVGQASFAPSSGGDTAPIVAADVVWVLTATCLVLLMTPGLAFFYAGMVSSKNVISTLLQSFVMMGVISIMWIFVGFSLAFGDSVGGVFGSPVTYFWFRDVGGAAVPAISGTIPLALFALFQLKFAIITPALITGSFAERVRFSRYVAYAAIWHVVVYCPLAHWTWHPNGFLRRWGVLDFAGGTVVHMSSGWAALAGALCLGRRQLHTWQNIHSGQNTHVPSNIPYVVLGTGMLWFGWFGFNAGSALAANNIAVLAFLTTNTACAAAMVTWIFFDGVRGRPPSALSACVGAVVGLVGITPAAGYVSVGRAVFIGCACAFISNLACSVKNSSSVDDTLDVFPCHGVGGMTGMLLTGLLANDVGVVAGHWKTFGAYTFSLSCALYILVDKLLGGFRVSVAKEQTGLDVSQHGESVHTASTDHIAPVDRTLFLEDGLSEYDLDAKSLAGSVSSKAGYGTVSQQNGLADPLIRQL